jgi:hypothetical protein
MYLEAYVPPTLRPKKAVLRAIIGRVYEIFPKEMINREGLGAILVHERVLEMATDFILPKSRADAILLARRVASAA